MTAAEFIAYLLVAWFIGLLCGIALAFWRFAPMEIEEEMDAPRRQDR